jgi:mRNA-degrading endonuclease RelE of RelBE toxin-antitoxin system
MKIKVITSENFRKKAKRLLKKYRSLKTELQILEKQLLENPELGTFLGRDCYKIRVAVQSKGKGKSGGVRIITHVVVRIKQNSENIKIVGLVTIYDKSEYESITDKEILALITEIEQEIIDTEND